MFKNEINGLLILAHALGVSRPCIIEVSGRMYRPHFLFHFDVQFDIYLFLQTATVIGQNKPPDLFQPITVAVGDNK